jgi:hypothetical protein
MVEYLKTVFSKVGLFDPAAVEEGPPAACSASFTVDMAPTIHEIKRAVMTMGNGEFGGDAKLPAECWKALMGDQLLLGYLVEVMDVYWKSGSYPESVATFIKLVQLQHNSTPQPSSQKPAQTAGESHGCKRILRVLAVNVERAMSATKGPLPSQLRYLLAADKITFVGISSLASRRFTILLLTL